MELRHNCAINAKKLKKLNRQLKKLKKQDKQMKEIKAKNKSYK